MTPASPPQQPDPRSTSAFPGERFPGQSFTVEQLARAIHPDQPETGTYSTDIAEARMILSRLGAVEPPLPQQPEAPKTIEEMAAEQGIGPITNAADLAIEGLTDEEADAFKRAVEPPLPVDPEPLRRAVNERHKEATTCGAPFAYDGDKERPAFDGTCGHYEQHPIHDLYDPATKRDSLSYPYRESDRHAYQPEGRGMCAADEDEWPCSAARLATSSPPLPVDPPATLRQAVEAMLDYLADYDEDIRGLERYEDAVKAALAAPTPAPPALDVERLAQILGGYRLRDSEYFAPNVADEGTRLQTPKEWAADIATLYARLSGTEPGE